MKTEILKPTPENLKRASALLRTDECVGMPTETVYGLAANALSVSSCEKIFKAKDRPKIDPLIVHVSSIESLREFDLVDFSKISAQGLSIFEKLSRAFWPGPLTLILPKTARVPDLVTSGLPSVAIRIPKHPVAQALLRECGLPLAAPSANRFGQISPTSASAVLKELGGRIPLILDGGSCEVGLESTVLRLESTLPVTILRPGVVTSEQIEAVLGSAPRKAAGSASESPGLLAHHYAPRKPLYLVSTLWTHLKGEELENIRATAEAGSKKAIGLLCFSPLEGVLQSVLGNSLRRKLVFGELTSVPSAEAAAQNLFRTLRDLDESEAEILFAETCPWTDGIGVAIRDRLARASTKLSDKL